MDERSASVEHVDHDGADAFITAATSDLNEGSSKVRNETESQIAAPAVGSVSSSSRHRVYY